MKLSTPGRVDICLMKLFKNSFSVTCSVLFISSLNFENASLDLKESKK
jgi:hypothetical protein